MRRAALNLVHTGFGGSVLVVFRRVTCGKRRRLGAASHASPGGRDDLSCLVILCLTLSCPVLPCLVLFGLTLPCHVFCCLTLSRPVLRCLTLSCHVLYCLLLSYLVSHLSPAAEHQHRFPAHGLVGHGPVEGRRSVCVYGATAVVRKGRPPRERAAGGIEARQDTDRGGALLRRGGEGKTGRRGN